MRFHVGNFLGRYDLSGKIAMGGRGGLEEGVVGDEREKGVEGEEKEKGDEGDKGVEGDERDKREKGEEGDKEYDPRAILPLLPIPSLIIAS
jgi:hypothetical protein